MGNYLIIQEHDSYVIAECARCDGSGKMRYTSAGITKDGTCEVCGGSGEIKMHKQPPFRECPRCEGAGEIGQKHSTCPTCDGAGFISHDDLEEV
jgi:DnaJ-class molecular chaperone